MPLPWCGYTFFCFVKTINVNTRKIWSSIYFFFFCSLIAFSAKRKPTDNEKKNSVVHAKRVICIRNSVLGLSFNYMSHMCNFSILLDFVACTSVTYFIRACDSNFIIIIIIKRLLFFFFLCALYSLGCC